MANYRIKDKRKDDDFNFSSLTDMFDTQAQCYICQQPKWCHEINIIFTYEEDTLYLCESCLKNRKDKSLLSHIITQRNDLVRKSLGLT